MLKKKNIVLKSALWLRSLHHLLHNTQRKTTRVEQTNPYFLCFALFIFFSLKENPKMNVKIDNRDFYFYFVAQPSKDICHYENML